MNMWVLRAGVGLAFLCLLAWGSDAWAVGVLNCDGSETSDSLDINNAGADGNLIFIFVAATSELLGGPRLDPFIEVRRLSDDAFVACNDDNGSSFGGCDAVDTEDVTGLSFVSGPFQLYAVGVYDSFVFFFNPPGGARVTIRASTFPAAGRANCGTYTVHIFGT